MKKFAFAVVVALSIGSVAWGQGARADLAKRCRETKQNFDSMLDIMKGDEAKLWAFYAAVAPKKHEDMKFFVEVCRCTGLFK